MQALTNPKTVARYDAERRQVVVVIAHDDDRARVTLNFDLEEAQQFQSLIHRANRFAETATGGGYLMGTAKGAKQWEPGKR
jgi:hypothetical protein